MTFLQRSSFNWKEKMNQLISSPSIQTDPASVHLAHIKQILPSFWGYRKCHVKLSKFLCTAKWWNLYGITYLIVVSKYANINSECYFSTLPLTAKTVRLLHCILPRRFLLLGRLELDVWAKPFRFSSWPKNFKIASLLSQSQKSSCIQEPRIRAR